MGVKLYKAGDSTVEVKVFDPFSLEGAFAEGWCIEEAGRKEEFEPVNFQKGKEEQAKFEEVDTNNTGKLSNKEVRKAAKKAGIEGWDTTRISNLKEQLGL